MARCVRILPLGLKVLSFGTDWNEHRKDTNNSIRFRQKLSTQVSAGCFQLWLLCEALLSFSLVFCLGQRLAGKKRLLRITSPCHTAVQWAEPGAMMCHGSTFAAFRIVFLCASFDLFLDVSRCFSMFLVPRGPRSPKSSGPSWEQLQAEHSELQNGDGDEAKELLLIYGMLLWDLMKGDFYQFMMGYDYISYDLYALIWLLNVGFIDHNGSQWLSDCAGAGELGWILFLLQTSLDADVGKPASQEEKTGASKFLNDISKQFLRFFFSLSLSLYNFIYLYIYISHNFWPLVSYLLGRPVAM